MKDLTSKDIPFLIVIILIVLVRDIWKLTKASYSYIRPYAIAALRYTKAEAIAATAYLCRLGSNKLLATYVYADPESDSLVGCLDVIAYSLVKDTGMLLGWVARTLEPETTRVEYFLE